MKIGNFINTNSKGQIVIPKSIRDTLNITDGTILHIKIMGQSISLVPIQGVISNIPSDSSYDALLTKTQGTWKNEDWKKLTDKRSKIELESSKKRANTSFNPQSSENPAIYL